MASQYRRPNMNSLGEFWSLGGIWILLSLLNMLSWSIKGLKREKAIGGYVHILFVSDVDPVKVPLCEIVKVCT